MQENMELENGRPAVFLDRDGVLAEERGYVKSVDELHIFPYAAECVQTLKNMGFLAIVVTNQSGVARGYFTEETLNNMNARLKEQTGVDAIYYCPHHPQGSIDRYARTCGCRKPETGMIERACRDFHIDMGKSFMIGDRASDIRLGEKAGLATILLESGYGTARLEERVNPDYILQDLRDAVRLLADIRQSTAVCGQDTLVCGQDTTPAGRQKT